MYADVSHLEFPQWSTDIFAPQTVVPAMKLIQILDFKELLGVLPAEFGKGFVGTTGSVGSPRVHLSDGAYIVVS